MPKTDWPAPDVEFEEADAEFRAARAEYDRAKSRLIEAGHRRERALRHSPYVRRLYDTSGQYVDWK